MSTSSVRTGPAWLDWFGWQAPVAIVVVTLLTTNIVQFANLMEQRSRLAPGAKELAKPEVQHSLEQAVLVRQKLQALAQEIVALAPNDPNAKKIQEDFRIQLNQRR